MHFHEQTEFSLMLHQNAELYNKTLSRQLSDIYWEDLRDYSLKDVWNAFKLHRKDEKSGKYMPKPSDLIKFLRHKENVVQLRAGKCGAHYRGYDCPLDAKHVEHSRGWCDYHFPIRQKVLKESSYCVLEDKIFFRILPDRDIRWEQMHWARVKERDEKKKADALAAAKKALEVTTSKAAEQTRVAKDILIKQNQYLGA